MKKGKDSWRYNYIGQDSWIIDDAAHIESPEDDIIDFLDGALKKDSSIDMHNIISSIPQKYRDILHEYYYEGLTLQKMGKSRGCSKQYMHQELKKAKSLIEKSFNF